MQIYFPPDRAVLIRITCDPFRSIPFRNTNTIIEFPGCARHGGAKKSIAMDFLGRDLPIRLAPIISGLSLQYDVDLLRVGPEHANGQIIAYPMRAQDTKWIGVCRGQKAAQFIRRQPGYLERLHFVLLSNLVSIASTLNCFNPSPHC